MIAYLDCSTGVSGDKLLGALVDAGFDPAVLRAALDGMGLSAIVVSTPRRDSAGASGAGVLVEEPDAHARDFRALKALLEAAAVPSAAREGALRALQALAEAEARVHGCAVQDVHFHEIGAADTLVDLLGVALALDALGITGLVASPVAVGSGTVVTSHGELPVPAPATALLLEGVPIVPGPSASELTTPTGAALLRAFATGFGTLPPMTLRRTGIGCGTRDIGLPNVCRLLVGEPLGSAPGSDEAVLLETNIDHLTPEELAVAADRLRDAGALDVWQTPIVMKKGRTATLLSLLAAPADAARLAALAIAETGTLGVRTLPVARTLAERDVTEIETSLGPARFKIARFADGTRTLRVESDDAARIASGRGLAVDAVARVLEADAATVTGVQPRRQPASERDTNPSA